MKLLKLFAIAAALLLLGTAAANAASLKSITINFDTKQLKSFSGNLQVKTRVDYCVLSDLDNRIVGVYTSESDFYNAKADIVKEHRLNIPTGSHVDEVHIQVRAREGNSNTYTHNVLQLRLVPSKSIINLALKYDRTQENRYSLASYSGCISVSSVNISADNWKAEREKDLEAGIYKPFSYPVDRVRPQSLVAQISDNAGGDKDDHKVRIDYVVRSRSNDRIVDVRTWESKMSSGSGFHFTAPNGQYIDQFVHVQVRIYSDKKWKNHDLGLMNIGASGVLTFTLNGSTGTKVAANPSSASTPKYLDWMSADEWVNWQKEIQAGSKQDHRYSGSPTESTRTGGTDTRISGTEEDRGGSSSSGSTGTFYGTSDDGKAGLIAGLVSAGVVVTGLTVGTILANTCGQSPAEIAAPVKTAELSELCNLTPVYFKHVYPSGNDLTIDEIVMTADIYSADGTYLRTDTYNQKITASEPNRTIRVGSSNPNERVYKWAYIKIMYYERGKQQDTKKLVETKLDLTSDEKNEVKLFIKGSAKDNSMVLLNGLDLSRADVDPSLTIKPVTIEFQHLIARSDKTVDKITLLYACYDDKGHFIGRQGFDLKLDRKNTSARFPLELRAGSTRMTAYPEIIITSGMEGTNNFKTICHTQLNLKGWNKDSIFISLTGSAQNGTVKLENGKESR